LARGAEQIIRIAGNAVVFLISCIAGALIIGAFLLVLVWLAALPARGDPRQSIGEFLSTSMTSTGEIEYDKAMVTNLRGAVRRCGWQSAITGPCPSTISEPMMMATRMTKFRWAPTLLYDSMLSEEIASANG
jgi:hypothetical protein